MVLLLFTSRAQDPRTAAFCRFFGAEMMPRRLVLALTLLAAGADAFTLHPASQSLQSISSPRSSMAPQNLVGLAMAGRRPLSPPDVLPQRDRPYADRFADNYRASLLKAARRRRYYAVYSRPAGSRGPSTRSVLSLVLCLAPLAMLLLPIAATAAGPVATIKLLNQVAGPLAFNSFFVVVNFFFFAAVGRR